MKNYIKPTFHITKFEINSSVMTQSQGGTGSSFLSEIYEDYIPSDVPNKVWTEMDDKNWNWN